MTTNVFSVGFLGLAVLGVIAVIIAVIVLAARDRAGKRVLIVGASLAAMAIAGLAMLTFLRVDRRAAVAQQLAVADRVVVLEARAGARGEASTTQQVTLAEGRAIEVQVGRAGDETSPTSRVPIVGGPAGRPELPADVWVSRATMFAALGVMVLLAYVFVDAGRRGRYTWPLRVGSAAAFALLCVLMGKLGPLM